jgi:Beta propeller domain
VDAVGPGVGRIGPDTQDGVTQLFAFELAGTTTEYVASGEVEGQIADRWAMDESGGVLRIAVGPTSQTGNFNSVVVLTESGNDLVELGRLDKLGVNEQIKSVRWFDDLAIVVTFRQTDPLYVIDLATPSEPRLQGELKIPGFSEYLHPLGPTRLIGVGQDASLQGITRGAQAALFNLRDLTRPEQVSLVRYRKTTMAQAGMDPRQFMWLPVQRTALTVITQGWEGQTGWVSELHVDGDRMTNTMHEVEYGTEVSQVRLVPLPSGRVVLVTGDDVRFFPLSNGS